jgi:hypothetical protein
VTEDCGGSFIAAYATACVPLVGADVEVDKGVDEDDDKAASTAAAAAAEVRERGGDSRGGVEAEGRAWVEVDAVVDAEVGILDEEVWGVDDVVVAADAVADACTA